MLEQLSEVFRSSSLSMHQKICARSGRASVHVSAHTSFIYLACSIVCQVF